MFPYYSHLSHFSVTSFTPVQVNQVLEIPFKSYIRMLACFPEKITFFDFNNSMSGLQHSEKVRGVTASLTVESHSPLVSSYTRPNPFTRKWVWLQYDILFSAINIASWHLKCTK